MCVCVCVCLQCEGGSVMAQGQKQAKKQIPLPVLTLLTCALSVNGVTKWESSAFRVSVDPHTLRTEGAPVERRRSTRSAEKEKGKRRRDAGAVLDMSEQRDGLWGTLYSCAFRVHVTRRARAHSGKNEHRTHARTGKEIQTGHNHAMDKEWHGQIRTQTQSESAKTKLRRERANIVNPPSFPPPRSRCAARLKSFVSSNK